MATDSPSNRVMRSAWSPALVVLLATTGCGEVLGADEYGFAEPFPGRWRELDPAQPQH